MMLAVVTQAVVKIPFISRAYLLRYNRMNKSGKAQAEPGKAQAESGKARFKPRWLLVVLGFAFALAVFTYPLVLTLTTRMYGRIDDDTMSTMWYTWYVSDHLPHLLKNPSLLFFTDLLYYPFGLNIYVAQPHIYMAWLMVPFRLLWGCPAEINLYLLLTLLGNAMAVFYLCKKLFGCSLSAFVAGLLFMLNSYSFQAASALKFEQANAWFIPLFILAYLRYVKHGGRLRAATAAVLLLFTGLFNWFHPLFLALLFPLHGVLVLLRKGRRSAGRFLIRVLAVCLIAGCCALPFLYPFVKAGVSGGQVQGISSSSLVPLSMPEITATPDERSGQTALTWISPSFFFSEPVVILSLLIIAPMFFFRKKLFKYKLPWFWIGGGVLFLLLSLGPVLWIPGLDLKIPLPYSLLYAVVPFFSRIVDTGRFSVMTYLCLGVTAGYSFSVILKKISSVTVRRVLGLIIIVIIITVPGWLAARSPFRLNEFPTRLKELKMVALKGGNVIDVPLLSAEVSAEALWWQTYHGFPLLVGPGLNIGYARPSEFDNLVENNSFLAFLAKINSLGNDDRPPHFEQPDLEAVKDLGFTVILNHLNAYFPSSMEINLSSGSSLNSRKQRMRASRALRKSLGEPFMITPDLEMYEL